MNQTPDLAALMPERDGEGYLIEPADWNEDVARALADEANIQLNDDHWDVIRFMRDYFEEHQVIADARAFGSGLDAAHLLARANIVTNKNLIPSDTPQDWDRPSGLRMGTIEVTRYGMREKEMDLIADFMARLLIEKQSPDAVAEDVIEFRQGYQTLFYNFDHGLPPQ